MFKFFYKNVRSCKQILLISGNIYPGVGSLSSEVARVSNDNCNTIHKHIITASVGQ